jgi:hypothetical protein
MSSKRDQIIVAAVALLGAAGKPTDLTISRQRTVSLSESDLPAQVLYAVHEEADASPGFGSDRKAKRKFRLCVESRVNAENSTPDAALDPLLSWAVKQLCADVTLGGLSYELREIGTTWGESEQEKVYASAQQFFEVHYLTDAFNPDTLT